MPDQDVVWAVEDLKARADRYANRLAYYEGRHARVLPEGKTLSPLLRRILDDLSDNLCDDVVDEPVGRLMITNWSGTGAVAQVAMDSWTQNRGTARSKDVHRNVTSLGDGFVIVQKDKDDVARWWPQNPSMMAVRYDQEQPDLIDLSAKAWKVGRQWRLNLYYADGLIRRFITRGSSSDGGMPEPGRFAAVTESDGAGEPMDRTDDERSPVHHFPHDEVSRYGRSVLTDVIPLQDLLNKAVADLVVAMEDVALPRRFASGIQVEYGPDGQEINPFQGGPQKVWRTGSKEARMEQFAAADLKQLLEVQETYRLRIAHKGYLPLHSVRIVETGGSAPSGISLLVAESRQVKRVKGLQDDGTLFWREVQAHTLSLGGTACEPEDLEPEWSPAETRDEAALVERLVMMVESLGLPKRQALMEAGYDAEDVDEWLEDAEAQRQAISGGRVSPAGASPLLPPPPGAPMGVPQPQGPVQAPAIGA